MLLGSFRRECRAAVASGGQFGYLLDALFPAWVKRASEIPVYGMDNSCYGGKFTFDRYLRAVAKARAIIPGRALFATVPDVWGDAEATLALWQQYQAPLRETGMPLAFVLQDGTRRVPWDDCAAVFVGGSNHWRRSDQLLSLAREAQRRGKWLHVGRVNTERGLDYAYGLGADSVDGSSFARYPTEKLEMWAKFRRRKQAQMLLPSCGDDGQSPVLRLASGRAIVSREVREGHASGVAPLCVVEVGGDGR